MDVSTTELSETVSVLARMARHFANSTHVRAPAACGACIAAQDYLSALAVVVSTTGDLGRAIDEMLNERRA